MSSGNRKRPKLVKLEILSLHPKLLEAIQSGSNVTGIYRELPLEDILVLDQMSTEHPGLRWVLRRQRRDRYLLTVLQTKHIDGTREEIKGQP